MFLKNCKSYKGYSKQESNGDFNNFIFHKHKLEG